MGEEEKVSHEDEAAKKRTANSEQSPTEEDPVKERKEEPKAGGHIQADGGEKKNWEKEITSHQREIE